MRDSCFRRWLLAGALCLAAAAPAAADQLSDSFQAPPDVAKPRVWWHWMNGNVTKEGVKLDLEWMKRAGIGGFQNFDASLMTPKLVDKRLSYMTPAWKDAFHYTALLADSLGLEMAIAGSPGWSESGGPWVEPQAAMKKLVWSETEVTGGRPVKIPLSRPPAVAGPFLDKPLPPGIPGIEPPPPVAPFYRDSAVIAFRTPEADARPQQALLSSNGGKVDAARLSDGSLAEPVELDAGPDEAPTWIQFDYGRPQALASFTLAMANPNPSPFAGLDAKPSVFLQASDDGKTWRQVASMAHGGAAQHTIAFPSVAARHFRMVFLYNPPTDLPPYFAAMLPKGPPKLRISELVLHPEARVNRFEEKAGFAAVPELDGMATPASADADAVKSADVVDLTGHMRPDGTLDWTPPAGRWTVLRMGYSLTGHVNGPASHEATGLEVDKLNRDHVHAYLETYLGQYQDAAGPGLLGAQGVRYMINDSWEAGTQNWTEDMIAEFARRRGYDPRPFLPVLTGRVVGSARASDGFLWDFRKTLADLVADEHYGEIARVLKAHGMGHYGESHESGRAFIGDGMEVKRDLDVPMAAMWVAGERQQRGYDADIRESASVAHIYGQNLVAAESLTAAGDDKAWGYSPEMLKLTADRELSDGVNRFVIHTSVHQPLVDKAPGLSLGPIGQWFTRNETWAEQAHAWTTYLARSSYMLQQGHFVADVAWYYGQDSNITALYGEAPPPIPQGYNFDFVNADALVHALSVKDGRLTAPSGMSYRLLALDPRTRNMTLPVLSRLRDLVADGAVVVGAKPAGSPSQADDPQAFQRLTDEVWGAGDGPHALGKGMVYPGELAEALATRAPADVLYTGAAPDTELRFVHRRTDDADIYFVNNRKDRADTVQMSFRIAGKTPELWRADTGAISPVSYRIEGGRTIVPLKLDPKDAVFVVFQKPSPAASLTIPDPVTIATMPVEGAWTVSFQPGRGAPASIDLAALAPLNENADPGVKYFSGAATYARTIKAPGALFKAGARQILDLGEVANLAEVSVNGKPLGVVWKHPFRVDVTGALKPGDNRVEIKVVDLWPNRLIGDMQPGATPVALANFDPYTEDSPLLPSGLIGPVKLVAEAPAR